MNTQTCDWFLEDSVCCTPKLEATQMSLNWQVIYVLCVHAVDAVHQASWADCWPHGNHELNLCSVTVCGISQIVMTKSSSGE